MSVRDTVLAQAKAAKEAGRGMARASAAQKDRALLAMAEGLEAGQDKVLKANELDLEAAKSAELSGALLDRLILNPQRVRAMADGLRELVALPDPVGGLESEWVRPSGLRVGRMRVPLGVIGMVYEARPNVTADAAGLCLKAGNAVILRGGSESLHSNRAIGELVARSLVQSGLPEAAVQVIATADRQAVTELLTLDGWIDCVIPRGGNKLLKWVAETATVPVIQHGEGNCHVYVDQPADLAMAAEIVFNAKVQRPGVCNAAETLLVHEGVAAAFLPGMLARLAAAKVELRGDEAVRKLYPAAKPATEQDWATEYLDLILAVRVVPGLDAALDHVARYGSGHSEAIVTSEYVHAERWLREVDAAAVLVSASTRLVDGGQFGLGAEIGSSTQKLHARGPMGLRELTTTKFVVRGQGQIRS